MQNKGIVDQAKGALSGLDIKSITSGVDAASIAIYFASFFVVGILFKKYFKHILIYTVISAVILKTLEHYTILPDLTTLVDWKTLKEFLGLKTGGFDFYQAAGTFLSWIKENLILFLASSLGFIFGYKVG